MACIFCEGSGPFTTQEHIIPESLGNDELVVSGIVCDGCQKYFGKEVEQFVLSKTPFAFWKVFYGIKSKKKTTPPVDLSLPDKQKGRLPNIHSAGDRNIVFSFDVSDGLAVEIDDMKIVRAVMDGSKTNFKFVLTPLILIQVGRFLGKIGIELAHSVGETKEKLASISELAKYSRYGTTGEIWPVLNGTLSEKLTTWTMTVDPEVEERTIYKYSMFEKAGLWVLFFDIGYERWGIVLNQKFPHPRAYEVLKNEECSNIKFLWYSEKSLKSSHEF